VRYETRDIDNRDAGQMYEYMEARIEALKKRIRELEKETETLRRKQSSERADSRYAVSA
jgi:phage shock protein A